MKEISILISFLLIFWSKSYTQTYSFKSMTDDNHYIQMDVLIENNIAYITKQEIDRGEEIYKTIFYGNTNFLMENGMIKFPNEGRFWFVPFTNDDSQEVPNGGSWCYTCDSWYNCSQGSCEWAGNGCEKCKCGSSGSNPCSVRRVKCDKNGNEGINRIVGVFFRCEQVIVN